MNILSGLSSLWYQIAIASLQGAVLIGVIALLQRGLRQRLGAIWTFALWFVVLVRLSLPTLPESFWSWQNLSDAAVARFQTTAAAAAVVSPIVAQERTPATGPAVTGSLPAEIATSTGPFFKMPHATNGSTAPALSPALSPASTLPSVPSVDGSVPWLPLIWFAGAVTFWGHQWIGALLFRRRVHQWRPLADPRMERLIAECQEEMGGYRPAEIRVAPSGESPCLFGVFRPVLLVPQPLLSSLTDAEWRHILLHEFAHLKRRDPLINAWMSLLRCVHWFNPLVWWAVRRMRSDRELACDAVVLARADAKVRHAYGETLLKLAVAPAGFGSAGTMVGILEDGRALQDRLRALKNRPAIWLNAVAGVTLLLVLSACALTRKKTHEPVSAARSSAVAPVVDKAIQPIQPLNLQAQVDYPQADTATSVLQHFSDNPGMWTQIPKGRQSFWGVPFEISGLIRLAGTSPQREEWYFRPTVTGVPVGRAFAQLYLLHATFYLAEPGTSIAKARLHYADGSTSEIPIRYGEDTLNYWRQRYEVVSQPTSAQARVAWNGDEAGRAEYGNSLRLCVAALSNPRPAAVVQSVDLVSTWESASEVIVGLAVGGTELPAEWRQTPPVREPEVAWQGRLRFRALNGVTGEPISRMELRLEVAEPGVHSRMASVYTDSQGWAELKYPHRELKYISIWADHAGFVPQMVQWTPRQHGPYPDEYIYKAEPGLRIAGRVTDGQGGAVAGAMVRIQGPRTDFAGDAKEFLMLQHAYAITDADGRWNCAELTSRVDPAAYQLRILHPDFQTITTGPLSAEMFRGTEIESHFDGQVVLSGRVRDIQNKPVAGARVTLRNWDRSDRVLGAITDAAGVYKFRPVPPLEGAAMSAKMLIQAPGFAPVLRRLLDEQGRVATGDVVLGPGRPVTIQVEDPKKEPLAGAVIEGLAGNGLHLDQRVTTDRLGRGIWEHTPDEPLSLIVSRTGYASEMFLVTATAANFVAQLRPTAELRAVVTDANTGEAIPTFSISRTIRGIPQDEATNPFRPVGIGRRGEMRFEAAPPDAGSTRYRIEAPGYLPSEPFTAEKLSGPVPTPIPMQRRSD